MKELELEAHKYAEKQKGNYNNDYWAFIEGATSKYVEKQKIKQQEEINFLKKNIKGLNKLINTDLQRYKNLHSLCNKQKLEFAIEQLRKLQYSNETDNLIEELEQKLIELNKKN